MGQKVHPYGFRLGYTKNWRSRWFAGAGYADLVAEDIELKDQLRRRLRAAGISSIELDRPGNKLRVTIRTARPGIIIGRRGSEIEKLKLDLQKKTNREIYIDIQEVHRPELDAQLVSESVAIQIEKRVAFRRAMRKAVDSALRFGCKGIKIWVAGRLNGNEIARREWYLQGRLPLQTLRADIDYGFTEARTTYGVIGVKCWIYKGEIIDGKSTEELDAPRRRERPAPRSRPGGQPPPSSYQPQAQQAPAQQAPAQQAPAQQVSAPQATAPAAAPVAPPAAAPAQEALPAQTEGGPLRPPTTSGPEGDSSS